MDPSDQEVDAYLERLGLPREPPGLAALTRLHVRHLQRVPFENLDIHAAVPIRLGERAALAKILAGRGGFCYELNGAFAWLLRALGYEVTLLEARVADGEGGFGIRFDHLTLRVDLERPVLADVGFGDCFVEPLALEPGPFSVQASFEYRLRSAGQDLVLERRRPADAWAPLYLFALDPRELADFEPGCTYHQTSPRSSFTKGPICTRLDGAERITLHRDRFTRGERITPVTAREQWVRLLEEHFGIIVEG